ncbi:actin-related protein Arp4p [Wallemia mellicola]|nr:actin-related protein Arp4p [Wallemia mellicola]
MVIYGADQVSALVASAGNSTLSAGYAGEDVPKTVIPTHFSHLNDKSYFGDNGPDVYRPGYQVSNTMKDSLVDDFDKFTNLLEYTFNDDLRVNTEDHPLLLTEPAWNTQKHREKLAEIAFEKFKVPGFYIANESVLSAFAAGKSTALIIDIGSDSTSITPIIDGFVLRKGVIRNNIGGNQLTNAYLESLDENQRQNVLSNLIPHQLIESKTTVELGQSPKFNLRSDTNPTDSWLEYSKSKILKDWREATTAVYENHIWDDLNVLQRPIKSFEFPTGFADNFTTSRYKASEILIDSRNFNPVQFTPNSFEPASINPSDPKSIAELIKESIQSVEHDSRTQLLSNVILVGGVSSMTGLSERIQAEISKFHTNSRVKVHSPANTVERKFAPWLGGSILGSLGTFHQLWISQDEWREFGHPIVSMRCK